MLAAREALAAEPGAEAGLAVNVGRSLTAVAGLLRETSQPPLRGRHESSCLLMARHNELDARPAQQLDDIEILFTWYAEDPLDAFILQGGDKQVRTFHMLAS